MNWAIGDIYVQNFRYMDKIWIQATYRHFPFFKAAFYTDFRIIIVFVANFEENNPKWMAFERLFSNLLREIHAVFCKNP